ncbi:hypothetical protein QJS10_CPA08g01848 [Acorus calamus]|uniref:Pre-mRNA-processing factor 39 n=1 Tax=Acorus calamus TaxID=4465 RepID=A0AAV9EAJ5_ACOCL|nr:hypothetical protein QJS10_CPA08g01848 [Acorus calamus]
MEARVETLLAEDPTNFYSWTSLLAEAEKAFHNDIQQLSLVYDSFLSKFPLCYAYWRKYASHKARLCTIDKVIEVHERAVQSATYSVDVWVDYCSSAMLLFDDLADVRSLKNLVAVFDEEIPLEDGGAPISSETDWNCETALMAYEDYVSAGVVDDLLDLLAGSSEQKSLKKYVSVGEHVYYKASELDAKIHCFESRIKRHYFHVVPIDDKQLENWHQYLDFVEKQGDFDWIVKLYERCLIPCANYPEFWIRYVELVESKGGREIADFALRRATALFPKGVHAIHVLCARFKEQIRDISGARAFLPQCGADLASDFLHNVTREANMERRLGNVKAASMIYENAIKMAKDEQKMEILAALYIRFSKFTYVVGAVSGNAEAARDILIKGIKYLPQCKSLIKSLLQFEIMHGGPRQINILDSIVADAITPASDFPHGLCNKDRHDAILFYQQFLDLSGTIYEINKAYDRHVRLFPHLVRSISSQKCISMRSSTVERMKEKDDLPVAHPCHGSADVKSPYSSKPSKFNDGVSSKDLGIQPEEVVIDQSQAEQNNNNEKSKHGQLADVDLKQSDSGVTRPSAGSKELVHEGGNISQSVREILDSENSAQIQPDCDTKDDITPPAKGNPMMNSLKDEEQHINSISSHDCNTSQTEALKLNGNITNCLVASDMQSTPTHNPAILSSNVPVETHDKTHPPTQVQEQQVYSQQAASNEVSHSAVSGGSWHPMFYGGLSLQNLNSGVPGYTQYQQHPQWQASPQTQHSAELNSPFPMSNDSHATQDVRLADQAQTNNQVAASAVDSSNSAVSTQQNMQQQSIASQSQLTQNMHQQNSVSATQPQLNVQPVSQVQSQIMGTPGMQALPVQYHTSNQYIQDNNHTAGASQDPAVTPDTSKSSPPAQP